MELFVLVPVAHDHVVGGVREPTRLAARAWTTSSRPVTVPARTISLNHVAAVDFDRIRPSYSHRCSRTPGSFRRTVVLMAFSRARGYPRIAAARTPRLLLQIARDVEQIHLRSGWLGIRVHDHVSQVVDVEEPGPHRRVCRPRSVGRHGGRHGPQPRASPRTHRVMDAAARLHRRRLVPTCASLADHWTVVTSLTHARA